MQTGPGLFVGMLRNVRSPLIYIVNKEPRRYSASNEARQVYRVVSSDVYSLYVVLGSVILFMINM